MNEQRIQEVFSDEAFVEKLFSLETPEEAQAALKEKNVEVSVEELKQLRDFIATDSGENSELSLDTLDDVAGGFLITRIAGQIKRAIVTPPDLPRIGPILPRTW